MTRTDKAAKLFAEGYNCAQSVAGAFDDVVGYDQATLLKMAAAFGGGFARTRNMCGTIAGMGMIIGLVKGNGEEDQGNNAEVYRLTQQAMEKFVSLNGESNCGALLKNIKTLTANGGPEKRSEEYYKARPCIKLVEDAVGILSELLQLEN